MQTRRDYPSVPAYTKPGWTDDEVVAFARKNPTKPSGAKSWTAVALFWSRQSGRRKP